MGFLLGIKRNGGFKTAREKALRLKRKFVFRVFNIDNN